MKDQSFEEKKFYWPRSMLNDEEGFQKIFEASSFFRLLR